MAVSVKTDLGEVKIATEVIADMILDVMSHPDLENKVWPATWHGHEIGKRSRISDIVDLGDSDFPSNIDVTTDENGKVTIEFSIIVRFGTSIRAVTRKLSDSIAEKTAYIIGVRPEVVIINIAGVRSRQTARRKTRTVYKYGTE